MQEEGRTPFVLQQTVNGRFEETGEVLPEAWERQLSEMGSGLEWPELNEELKKHLCK